MDYKKIGLYRIKRVRSLVTFELDLLKNIRIYPVFYILLLELVLPRAPRAPNTKVESNLILVYNIERILNSKLISRKVKYLIK